MTNEHGKRLLTRLPLFRHVDLDNRAFFERLGQRGVRLIRHAKRMVKPG